MVDETFDLKLLEIKNKLTSSGEFKNIIKAKHQLFGLMLKLSGTYDVNSEILWDFLSDQIRHTFTWDKEYLDEHEMEIEKREREKFERQLQDSVPKEQEPKAERKGREKKDNEVAKEAKEAKEAASPKVRRIPAEEMSQRKKEKEKAKLKVDYQEQLRCKEIVLGMHTYEERLTALAKITQHKILLEIWEESFDKRLKLLVLKLLKCPNIDNSDNRIFTKTLVDSAIESNDRDIRAEAVKYLHNPLKLKELAESDGDKRVRRAAIRKVQDQNTLKNVVRHSTDQEMRLGAIKNINDRTFLYNEIIRNELTPAKLKRCADRRLRELGGTTVIRHFDNIKMGSEVLHPSSKEI